MQGMPSRHRSGKVTRHQGPQLAAQFIYLPDVDESKVEYIASWQKKHQILDPDDIVHDAEVLLPQADGEADIVPVYDPNYIPCSNLDDELDRDDAAGREILSKVIIDIKEPLANKNVSGSSKHELDKEELIDVESSLTAIRFSDVDGHQILLQKNDPNPEIEVTQSHRTPQYEMTESYQIWNFKNGRDRETVSNTKKEKDFTQNLLQGRHFSEATDNSHGKELQLPNPSPATSEIDMEDAEVELILRHVIHSNQVDVPEPPEYKEFYRKVQVVVVADDNSSIVSGELVTNLDDIRASSALPVELAEEVKDDDKELVKQETQGVSILSKQATEPEPDYPSSESGQVELTDKPSDKAPLKWAYYSGKRPQVKEAPVTKHKKELKSALKRPSKNKLLGRILQKKPKEKAISFIDDNQSSSLLQGIHNSPEANNRIPYMSNVQVKQDNVSEHSSHIHIQSHKKLRRTTLFEDSSSRTSYSHSEGAIPMRLPGHSHVPYKLNSEKPDKLRKDNVTTEWKAMTKVAVEQSKRKELQHQEGETFNMKAVPIKSMALPGIQRITPEIKEPVSQVSPAVFHKISEQNKSMLPQKSDIAQNTQEPKKSSAVFQAPPENLKHKSAAVFQAVADPHVHQSSRSVAIFQILPDHLEQKAYHSPAIFQANVRNLHTETSNNQLKAAEFSEAAFEAVPHQEETKSSQVVKPSLNNKPLRLVEQNSVICSLEASDKTLRNPHSGESSSQLVGSPFRIMSSVQDQGQVSGETIAGHEQHGSDPLYHSISRTNPVDSDVRHHTTRTGKKGDALEDVIREESVLFQKKVTMVDHATENTSEGIGCCGYILLVISGIVIFFTLPVSLCLCIKVVQEYERAVIFRLGRLVSGGAKGPGLFFIIPCMDNYIKVDLRTVSFDVPPQEVLSKDSVTVAVDAVVYYRISNATISVTNVEDANRSTRLLAATTLRNVLGTKNLSEILSDRENISHMMQSSLDEATDPWGVKVERVEVKDVRLPVQLQRAMAAEAEAAREARAKVIAAEGEQKASRALKEAADIINESPSALQLRYLQTLNTISAEKNSTIVFPIPVDMMQGLMKK